MRVVLDTNVLVSGLFHTGTPARILDAWDEGKFDLLASLEILDEYERVVERLRKRYPGSEVRPILDVVLRECRLVRPAPVALEACEDPDDLKFLVCAIAGGAWCVVSGDRALLRSTGHGGCIVVTPAEFLDRLS